MERFESYEDALANAISIDQECRELEAGEDFGSLTMEEASNIIHIHATGGGMWTWCYQSDMAD